MKTGLLAAAITASGALAQGGPPPGAGSGSCGPGMMGGYGSGMMGGYGPGMMGGYGPGMMGGYGSGMMGGYGSGMMGGRGMMGGGSGPGMTGSGYGMGYGAYAALDLTDEQRQKLAALGEQSRSKAWDTMGRLRTEQFRLRELLRAEPVNASAVVDQQAKIDELRRQVLKSRIEARNEMAAVLTSEQRKKLRDTGPWWYRDDDAGE
jgi:Spy/CpxP family protein refolding chaperone